MNDKDVTIVIRANTSQFAAAMAAAQNMAKNMGQGIASGASPAQKAFDTIKQGVESATSSIEYMAKRGAMIGTALFGIGAFGVNAAGQLETAQIGFETLLGSTEKARAAIEMIKKDARSTPFELTGLAQANQLLTGITGDAQRSEKFLLNIGKALAAMGRGQPELDRIIINLQQIGQVGYASEVDMKQFAYAGVDAYKLVAESTGMTVEQVRNLQDEGKLTFDMLEKAFNDAGTGAGKYAKAFDNANGSWQQTWSNFRDTVSQSMAAIVKDSGLFDEVKKNVKALGDWINANKDQISGFVKGAFEWLSKNGNTVKNIIIGIAAAYAFLKTVSITMKVIEGVQNAIKIGMIAWKGAVIAFTAAQWLLNAALSANPIGLVIIAITALIAAIVLLWNNSQTFRDIVTGAFNAVWNAIKSVWDWVSQNWPLLLAILMGPIGIAVLLIIQNWDTIKAAFAAAWEFIKGVWSGVAGFFAGVWQGIVNVFAGVSSWFGDRFRDAWNGIKSVFGAVGGFFQGVWNTITSIFGRIGSAIGDTVGGAFKSVINGIIGFAERTINGFINTINGAIGAINKIPGVNIPKLGNLSLPRMASGGIVEATRGGQNVTLAEGGQNEWVVPESKMASLVRQINARSEDSGQAASTNNYTFNIEITVQNDGTDFTEAQATGMAKQIVRALRGQGLQINEMGALR
jgi:tape measure domain-containing protein